MTEYCHSWGKSEKIVSSQEDQNTTKDKWKIGEGKVWGEKNKYRIKSSHMPYIWCKLYWFWNWLKFPDTIWVGLREIMKATGVGSRSTLQGIFPAQGQSQVSHIAGGFFTSWATRETQEYWSGSLSLLQRIFQTQKSNQGLLHCRQIVYQLSYQGSPVKAQEGWYQSHQMHRTGEHQTQCHVFPNPRLSFLLTSQLDPVSTMSGSEMVQGNWIMPNRVWKFYAHHEHHVHCSCTSSFEKNKLCTLFLPLPSSASCIQRTREDSGALGEDAIIIWKGFEPYNDSVDPSCPILKPSFHCVRSKKDKLSLCRDMETLWMSVSIPWWEQWINPWVWQSVSNW